MTFVLQSSLKLNVLLFFFYKSKKLHANCGECIIILGIHWCNHLLIYNFGCVGTKQKIAQMCGYSYISTYYSYIIQIRLGILNIYIDLFTKPIQDKATVRPYLDIITFCSVLEEIKHFYEIQINAVLNDTCK